MCWFEHRRRQRFKVGPADIVVPVELNEWARVRLTRPITLAGDFDLQAVVSWTSGASDPAVMQYVTVSVRDDEGTAVASSYYWDAWVGWRGAFGGRLPASGWYDESSAVCNNSVVRLCSTS